MVLILLTGIVPNAPNPPVLVWEVITREKFILNHQTWPEIELMENLFTPNEH